MALIAYFGFWPVPVEPVSWDVPIAPGYAGAHAPNNRLAGLHSIALGGEEGPEHVVLARDGKLYASMVSGTILRMDPDGSAREVFVNTGGRVLGFDFDVAGSLIAADAMRGVLAIAPDRTITVLIGATKGGAVSYPNSLVVAGSGVFPSMDSEMRRLHNPQTAMLKMLSCTL